MKKCLGCGAVLQTKDKNKLGYVPLEKWSTAKLCERCFRLIHYNDLKVVDFKVAETVLKDVNHKGKFAFFLVDLLNINTTVIKTYHQIKIPKCFVVSKIDFIPKYINKNNIKIWLKEEYQINEEIYFLSAYKNQNIHCLESVMIDKNCLEAYLLGYTNSGKSTLINKIMDSNQITTSLLPNTTANFIKIKLDSKLTLIDSPGFLYPDSLYDQSDVTIMKKINPQTFLKPITFQLKKGMSIVIENLIRIENVSDKCNLTFYMSNLLEIKKIYAKNTYLKDGFKEVKHLKRNEDMVITGIGFINCKSTSQLNLYLKKPGFVEIRNSFFER